MGNAAQFGADDVRGKTGAEKAAIQRSDLLLPEGAANVREVALEARPDGCRFIRFGKDGVQCGVDVAIGYAARAQLARNAEASLAARVRVLVGKFESVARIIEIIAFTQLRDHRRDHVIVFGAAIEIFAHLVN